jgi:hypothetical protein
MGTNKRLAQDMGGSDVAMYSYKRKRISLMPAVALATLSALIAIPALSQARLFAAGPQRTVSVTVRPGENLWTIADRYTAADANTQETVDAIKGANHLATARIIPGQRLLIPQ